MTFWDSKKWLAKHYKDDNGLPGFFLEGGYRGDKRLIANKDYITTVKKLKETKDSDLKDWCVLMEESAFMCLETTTMDLFWLLKLRVGIKTLERLRFEKDTFVNVTAESSLACPDRKRALSPSATNHAPRKRIQAPQVYQEGATSSTNSSSSSGSDSESTVSHAQSPAVSSHDSSSNSRTDSKSLKSVRPNQHVYFSDSASEDTDAQDSTTSSSSPLQPVTKPQIYVGRDGCFIRGMGPSIGTIVKRTALTEVDSYLTASDRKKYFIICGMNNVVDISDPYTDIETQLALSFEQASNIKRILSHKVHYRPAPFEFKNTLRHEIKAANKKWDILTGVLYNLMRKTHLKHHFGFKIALHIVECYRQYSTTSLCNALIGYNLTSIVSKIWAPLLDSVFYGSGIMFAWGETLLAWSPKSDSSKNRQYRILCNLDKDSSGNYEYTGNEPLQLGKMVAHGKAYLDKWAHLVVDKQLHVALLMVNKWSSDIYILRVEKTDLFVLEKLVSLELPINTIDFQNSINELIFGLQVFRELCTDGVEKMRKLQSREKAPGPNEKPVPVWYPPEPSAPSSPLPPP